MISWAMMGYTFYIFGITNVMYDYLGLKSIHLSGILLTGIETVGYFGMILFADRFKRRTIHIFIYFSIAVLSAALFLSGLFFVDHRTRKQEESLSFMLGFEIGISFFI